MSVRAHHKYGILIMKTAMPIWMSGFDHIVHRQYYLQNAGQATISKDPIYLVERKKYSVDVDQFFLKKRTLTNWSVKSSMLMQKFHTALTLCKGHCHVLSSSLETQRTSLMPFEILQRCKSATRRTINRTRAFVVGHWHTMLG